MAWLAVDKDGNECVYQFRPKRNSVQLYRYIHIACGWFCQKVL